MFKNVVFSAAKLAANIVTSNSKILVQNVTKPAFPTLIPSRNISYLLPQVKSHQLLLKNVPETSYESIRTIIKFDWKRGKRQWEPDVLKRFYRLRWGGWIRRIAGCHKRIWKKKGPRKKRAKQHVFCNATQSALLDKMVGPVWRKPRYFVDDPYEPYHSREEFLYTAKKPRPYIPPEER